jgi:uncharacterized phiE125 gp8 family phage protein
VLARLVTAPATEPISLAEAKAHLRLETDVDNPEVSSMIQGARQYAEEVCWRGLVTQTWELILAEFPSCGETRLPRGNLASITSVKYIDGSGVEQTMSSGDYEADTASVPGKLKLGYGKSWPAARSQWNAVKIQYVVGWSAALVPQPIKNALLLLISQMYEHRTPEVIGASVEQIQFSMDALLAPYRLNEV